MNFEFVKFLTVLICACSIVEPSFGCGNRTRQKRDDGPDFAGLAAAGAAMAVDLMQQGGGFKNNFKVKIGNRKQKLEQMQH